MKVIAGGKSSGGGAFLGEVLPQSFWSWLFVYISKAHRAAGEWDDLRFHGICDLPNQAILVGHSCVQGCEDRLLERRFIQCG